MLSTIYFALLLEGGIHFQGSLFAMASVCGRIIPPCSFLKRNHLAFLPPWAPGMVPWGTQRGGWDPRRAAEELAFLQISLECYLYIVLSLNAPGSAMAH